MHKVVVTIPVYKKEMSEFEKVSFVQCCKILNKYNFSLICPENLDLINYKRILRKYNINYAVEKFDDKFFKNVKSYNELMLSVDFYKKFQEYEFMLVHQLDAYVFKNKLEYWCNKDFDYIGAPWFESHNLSDKNSKLIEPSANGGFSLRKIQSFIDILENAGEVKAFIDEFIKEGVNEDLFFSQYTRDIEKDFKVALTEDAIKFSFECQPERLFAMTGKKLPFGCHAWERYNFDFWEKFIDLKNVDFQKENKLNLKKVANLKNKLDIVNEKNKFLNKKLMHENVPLVTVVTITFNLIKYNREKYFHQCMKSVQDQTYENIEHVIIDGGSKDGTLDLIKKYTDKGLVKYISEPDEGIYDAMNKGIKLAKGKYVAFLNSDDYWHDKNGIKDTVKALEKNNADFSYAPARLEFEKGDFYHERFKYEHQYYNPKISNIFFSMAFCHQTMFTKREVMLKENMFDTNFRSAGDYDFIIRLCLKKYKSVLVDNQFTTFRLGGLSGLDSQGSIDEVALIHFNHYRKLIPLNKKEASKIMDRGFKGISKDLANKLKEFDPYFNYGEYVNNFKLKNKVKYFLSMINKEKRNYLLNKVKFTLFCPKKFLTKYYNLIIKK